MVGSILLALALIGVSIILPIWSFVRISSLRDQLQKLSSQVLELRALADRPAELPDEAKPASTLKQDEDPGVKSEGMVVEEEPVEEVASSARQSDNDNTVEEQTAQPDKISASKNVQVKGDLEENLASKWFVWIGAAAIALAGVFLVKYIADRGILTPAVRMFLAFAMGIVLAFGGEWVRRRPIQKIIASIKPSYVPMALTASGILVMYISVYASYGLYDLIGPLFAFVLLALVSFLAFALSILQGAPVAILGLVGGLVTPALVSTNNPSAIGLFGYLSIVILACVAVMRYRPWWWLGFAATAGSALWIFIWTVTQGATGDVMIIGAFLTIVISALSLLVHADQQQETNSTFASAIQAHSDLGGYKIVSLVAIGVLSLTYLMPFVSDRFSNPALVFLVIVGAIIVVLAYVRPRLEPGVFATIGLAFAGFGLWGLANLLANLGRDFGMQVDPIWQPPLSPEVFRYVKWAAGIALSLGVGGFVVASRRDKPVYWLALSIVSPIGLLIISYLALQESFADRNWAFAGLLLALAALFACVLVRRRPRSQATDLSLGLYATAVVVGISLTMVFLLKDAWLTVALALQLPAIAWISNQLKLDILRKIALVIAAAILIRLAANPFLADYAKQHFLGNHWVLYGYGVPALATHFAAVWFRQQKDDRLVMLLEGLRVIFAVLLITAEIRIFATGGLTATRFSFAESAMQSVAWLTVAWSRLRAFSTAGRLVDKWSGFILLILGAATTFGVSLLIQNPVLSGDNIGKWPLFNTLLLAYVGPAVLIWFISRLPIKEITDNARAVAGIGVLILLFTYVTLETRHVFQGPVMQLMPISDAETYTYSVVWLVFAFALLMFGLVYKRPVSRYAALIVLIITVLKVFLSDMNGLAGLWRVASFLGLGLSLVGIGYLYQRFLYLPTSAARKPVAKDS